MFRRLCGVLLFSCGECLWANLRTKTIINHWPGIGWLSEQFSSMYKSRERLLLHKLEISLIKMKEEIITTHSTSILAVYLQANQSTHAN